jgi:hypothetical protein
MIASKMAEEAGGVGKAGGAIATIRAIEEKGVPISKVQYLRLAQVPSYTKRERM